MSAIGETFLLFEQGAEEPDPRVARELFVQALAMQRELGGDLELDDRELLISTTLTEVAALSHELEDWVAMRDAATEARELDPEDVSAHTMSAVALRHLGDLEGAKSAVERAMELGPDGVTPLQELAAQRLVANDRAAALDAIERAMTNGAEPGALLEDRDLAALHGDPRWEQLLSREHYVASLVALLEREHTKLAASGVTDDDDWDEDDDALDAVEEGVDLAERILEAAALDDVPSLPVGPDGSEIIDASACDPTQLRAIEALLAADAFWPSLEFQLVLARYRLPSVSPADARERLGT